VTKAASLIALGAISVLCAAPAAACPGPFAERYLVWFELPDLLPGEVAIEIDMRDFAENRFGRSYDNPEYKIKRILVGVFHGDHIRVQAGASSCNREVATGTAERLFLIGRLREIPGGEPVLNPRYMNYNDPIRIEAARTVPRQHTEAGNRE
jgi:hypothetical protein